MFCAYCPKIAPISVHFARGLSAVALAQVNLAKNKQIEENVKPRLIAASQPKLDSAAQRHVVAFVTATIRQSKDYRKSGVDTEATFSGKNLEDL